MGTEKYCAYAVYGYRPVASLLIAASFRGTGEGGGGKAHNAQRKTRQEQQQRSER